MSNPDTATDPWVGAPVGSRPWLHAFALAARSATLDLFTNVNTCIASTLIGAHALGRFDIKATPTSVWVEAINAKAYRLREAGVHPSQWPGDAWSVGIRPGMRATDVVADHRGADGKPHGWDGHLVLVLRRGPGTPRTLIDLTADQLDRPARAINVGGPVFMDIPAGAPWTPQDPLSTVMGGRDELSDPTANPTALTYWPAPPGAPESRAWKTAPDTRWLSDPAEPEVAAIIDAVCAEIARLTGAGPA